MAPTLTSNSFILSTTPRSRLRVGLKNPKFTILAEAQTGGEGGAPSRKLGDLLHLLNLEKIPDVKSLVPVVTQPATALSFVNRGRKDPGTVYVAGATGQAGVRIAQTLLRQGFTVRAGVPELAAAQDLARLASQYQIISPQESRRLNAVQSTFEDAEIIAKAIGNASKVVVTIGPTENGPAKEVTTSDALQVIRGAQLAGVGHVAIVYDGRSISGPSSTYNVLDGISSFFGNLFSPQSQPLTVAEFLEEVVQTDVAYTLIKTSLTEDFSPESSYNVVVSPEGISGTNDLKVAKSQIASLIADVLSNTAMAENKVVQVSTDPSAPRKPIDELLSAIPEDGRRKAYAEALAKAKAEEDAVLASERAREAAEAAKKLEDEVEKLSKQEAIAARLAEEARQKAEVAGTSVETLLKTAKDIGSGLSWQKLSSQISSTIQKKPDEDETEQKPKVQIATIRGQAKARTLPSQKAVLKQRTSKPPPTLKPKVETTAETKPEVRKVFGGLFQQETIYMDD
ncbi:protein PLASTID TRANSCRIPTIONALLY ACTIVE 16, chloroplastic [Telopea speciosissima]|uniref:protein PLASTID TRANSCRIPTIONALLY ACTIVE 16, chloroplastic n=1 Tax=Telopea speciosissima TaxID=54955 RepID=UPI001CC7A369|nr:protein PLASTID TRANSCRIPTIONALLY ACTIVE 16, chloroplastic [Telopea speciosissima]XP_043700835.1 protein PLASTID TRANSCRIPTIONALLY ACTIVE 16, chloroplastic [Telopea speciosissima]XP_043700836.1 protein PLASTID TRANSCRIPTIONALLY ACTIVE 16, chloroplastic [Telopea speciosissima]